MSSNILDNQLKITNHIIKDQKMSEQSVELEIRLALARNLQSIFNKAGNKDSIVAGVFYCMGNAMDLTAKTIKTQISQQQEIDTLKKTVEELKRLSAPDYKKPLFDKPKL
jgi:hypothetical protein